MTGDGRTSQDWLGIASDNSIKVHEGKNCIFGTCGKAAAKIIVQNLLKKTQDPFKLIKLLHHKDFKDILQDSHTLVATQRYGCYSLNVRPSSNSMFSSGSAIKDVVLWDDDCLPQIIGSGFLNVRTLLSQYDKVTPELVKESIRTAYKTNHTIGGLITEVKLKC